MLKMMNSVVNMMSFVSNNAEKTVDVDRKEDIVMVFMTQSPGEIKR